MPRMISAATVATPAAMIGALSGRRTGLVIEANNNLLSLFSSELANDIPHANSSLSLRILMNRGCEGSERRSVPRRRSNCIERVNVRPRQTCGVIAK